jgi:Rha family phage regulatory protein
MNKLIELGLVTRQEKVLVSSRVIAERFEKRHDNVINKIESTIKNWMNDTDLKNKVSQYFVASSYKDASGKNNKEYLLSRDGFSYIVMGLTGRDADYWKIRYIEAFNTMEAFIREKMSADWQQARLTGKQVRRDETDIILTKLIPLAESQGSKNAGKLYMTYSKLVNTTLMIEADQRNYLPQAYVDAIKFLERAIENIISQEVDKGT